MTVSISWKYFTSLSLRIRKILPTTSTFRIIGEPRT